MFAYLCRASHKCHTFPPPCRDWLQITGRRRSFVNMSANRLHFVFSCRYLLQMGWKHMSFVNTLAHRLHFAFFMVFVGSFCKCAAGIGHLWDQMLCVALGLMLAICSETNIFDLHMILHRIFEDISCRSA